MSNLFILIILYLTVSQRMLSPIAPRHLAHVPIQASSIVHATMKASPFFKVVRGNFDEFEMVYPERY
jgi:hypothetical protein